jgi:PAS domain S-box-containing protein
MNAGLNKSTSLPTRITTVAAILVSLVGLGVLTGWAIDSDRLKTVFPGLVTMKPNTAAGLLLSALSLGFLTGGKAHSLLRWIGTGFALTVVCLGAVTLAEYFLDWDAGIDELLFRDPFDKLDTSRPGQMAPSTAFCFVLAGSALLIGARTHIRPTELSAISALGATLVGIGGVASIGQLSNALFHFHLWNYFWMAIHTALSFVILGVGLLALSKGGDGLKWVLDPTTSTGFAAAVLGMLIAACVSWGYAIQLRDSSRWVNHTQQVLKGIEDIRACLAELQSDQRGYVIQGDASFLDEREKSKTALSASLQDLRDLIADNPRQERSLDQLEQAAAKRTAFDEQVILLRRERGFLPAQQKMREGDGIKLSQQMEQIIGVMRDEEYRLLSVRQKDAESVVAATFLLEPLCIFLSLTALSLALFILNSGTRQRQMAEELSAQLAEIVNSSNDAIIGKDLTGIITSWNKGAEAIFGYSAREMVGGTGTALISPGGEQPEMEKIHRLERGESGEHFESRRLAKDGHLVDVSVTVSPIKDKPGTIVGSSVVERDITESKQAREALRRSEDQFRTMANAIPQLAWMADADGSIFWYNQRWFDYTGTTQKEMEGWGWQSVHDPESLPGVMNGWKDALARGVMFEMEFPLRAAEGNYGWFLTRVLPMKDEAGRIVRWFGTNTDLTQKREAEEAIHKLNATLEQRVVERTAELEIANKELEAFSYSVSHDLRAPLRAVDGFAQAAIEDYGAQLPAPGQRQLQIIRESAQRMGTLIDDLLAFSRLSRAPLVLQEINTARQVAGILENLKREENGRAIEVRLGALPSSLGTPPLLEQVWFNLLANAFKYTRQQKNAVVEVGCRREAERNVFFVRDNGVGFDMKYANKLFGVFQRLHRSDEFEGTGVGLAIVQRILQRHGEKIWVEAAPNQGATFHFTLQKGPSHG